MHLLQKNRTRGQKGYSLAMWAAVFAVVVAAFVLIRVPLKRALQGKIIATTDYMFWTKWSQPTRQYKGEDTSFVKTDTTQNVSATQSEKNKYINYNVNSKITEGTISFSVEDGSQVLLRGFSLDPNAPTPTPTPTPCNADQIQITARYMRRYMQGTVRTTTCSVPVNVCMSQDFWGSLASDCQNCHYGDLPYNLRVALDGPIHDALTNVPETFLCEKFFFSYEGATKQIYAYEAGFESYYQWCYPQYQVDLCP